MLNENGSRMGRPTRSSRSRIRLKARWLPCGNSPLFKNLAGSDGNLTVTPQGVSGNNSQLASQTNVGLDLGTDWTPDRTVKLSVTGFYEFFRNEQVTQSPGAGLQNFTFNVPRSVHRGVEVAADWRPVPGWRLIAAYTYLDQFYVDYTEQLSAGTLTRQFDRAGNKIPGISPNELFTRLGYDQPIGPWRGVGGFVDTSGKTASTWRTPICCALRVTVFSTSTSTTTARLIILT